MTKKKTFTTGADRSGIRASDFLAQVINLDGPSPIVEKSKQLIETMRVSEKSKLTAQALALNELFYAHARNEGIDQDTHEISMRTCMKYLNEVHSDRVIDAIDRIAEARVRYDIETENGRHIEWMNLINSVSYREDLSAGTAIVTYEIPRIIRQHILNSTHYGFIELNAFPKFNCKYTARLYPRLAYRAGMSGPYNKQIEFTPQELAESLDFRPKSGKFVYGQFSRDVLQPIMKDIADHVRRFQVDMTEVRGKGRGNPVEKIVFKVTEATKTFNELKSKKISGAAVSDIHNDQSGDLPSPLAVGRACTAFGMDAEAVLKLWQAFVARMRPIQVQALELSRYEGFIIQRLDDEGAEKAFEDWCEWHRIQRSKPSNTFDIDQLIPPTFERPNLNLAFKTSTPAPIAVAVEPEPVIEIPEEQPTKLSIREENRRVFTEKLLLILDNKCDVTGRKKTYEDWVVANYCDIDIPPWTGLDLDEDQHRNLANALRRLSRGTSANMRSTLKTLALAVVENDLAKIDQVSKAIYASRAKPKTGLVRPFAGPNSGLNSTRQVTELSAEYDFADPAYGHSVSFDDIDHPDADNG